MNLFLLFKNTVDNDNKGSDLFGYTFYRGYSW